MHLFASLYDQERLLDIRESLDIVGLAHVADQRVESFSKGMKMRLNEDLGRKVVEEVIIR